MQELDVRFMPELALDELAAGEIHRLYVGLVEDATGAAVRTPVIVAKGSRPGPTLGLTAAIHGNEVNGIPVIHSLFSKLEPKKLGGTVVAVPIVNMPGFHRHGRTYADGTDLNDVMPGEEDGNASALFANRLMSRIVRHFDYLIDLHTASFGRQNSLYVRADMTHEAAARMAYLLRPQIVAHKPASDGTLRGSAMDLGIPSVTLEIGDPSRFQPPFIRSSVQGVRAVMASLEMLKGRPVKEGPPPILCEKSYWVYAQRGGLLQVFPALAERVKEGAPLAEVRDIFGRLVIERKVPEDAIVIGKSTNPVGSSGARIVHLGIEVAAGDTRFYWRTG